MKLLLVNLLFILSISGHSQGDSTATNLDTLSWIWPVSGEVSNRGWEPKTADLDFERFVRKAASEINKNWNPGFIKVCRCSGVACPQVRYVGTSKYITNTNRQLYILYYDAGYGWIKTTWRGDSLKLMLRGLISHEIAHVVHHHPWLKDNPDHDLESEADYYCGKMMYTAWRYTEAEAIFAIAQLATVPPTASYYSKERRIKDIKQGYLDAKENDEKGKENEKKSTLVAVENTRRNIFKSVNDIGFNTEIFRDSIGFVGSPRLPKVLSNKQARNDSLAIIFYQGSYRLCVISKRTKDIVNLGTIVPSGRFDYPYVIYDRTFHYWYMSNFEDGRGYSIYAFSKDIERRLVAPVIVPVKIEFGFN